MTSPDASLRCASLCCPARLHLGFLDLQGGVGRRFGSIGLLLDQPATRVSIRRAERTSAHGPDAERALSHLQAAERALGVAPGHALTLAEAVPAHGGLGSGTQLALAVYGALRRLHDLPDDPQADARSAGRGRRSGIGITLFREGGLVVDGGVVVRDRPDLDDPSPGPAIALPPLLARLAVPEDWRVLLVLDREGSGLSGHAERRAFAALPPMGRALAAELCHLALMGALPSLAQDDLDGFGRAIGAMQRILGEHFAPAQGGRFASPRVAAALEALSGAGAVGPGQSSWGPTGFCFVRGQEQAQRLADGLRLPPGLDLLLCRGSNQGALQRA